MYWVKNSVTKKRLGDFVNQKLKNLGYKTKKLNFVAPKARYRRTFKQAQNAQLYPEAPSKKKAGPKLTSKKPFPFQRKATEQEIEELQKRREPENIEMFQLSKDALLDLARKADLKGRSAMTKGQLITALRNKPIEEVTPEEMKAVAEAPLAPLIVPRTTEEKVDKKTMIKEYVRLSAPAFVPAKFKLGPRRLESLSNESLGSRILGLQKFLHDRNERAKRDFGERKQREEKQRLDDIALQEAQDIEGERLEAQRVEDERRRNLEAREALRQVAIQKRQEREEKLRKKLTISRAMIQKRRDEEEQARRALEVAKREGASKTIQSALRAQLAKRKAETLKVEREKEEEARVLEYLQEVENKEADDEFQRAIKVIDEQFKIDEKVYKEVSGYIEKIVTNPPTTREQALLLIPKIRELGLLVDTTSPETQDTITEMLQKVLSLVQEKLSELQKQADAESIIQEQIKRAQNEAEAKRRDDAEKKRKEEEDQAKEKLIQRINSAEQTLGKPQSSVDFLKSKSLSELENFYRTLELERNQQVARNQQLEATALRLEKERLAREQLEKVERELKAEADRKQREKDEKARIRREKEEAKRRVEEDARRAIEEEKARKKEEDERKELIADIRKVHPNVLISKLQNMNIDRLRIQKDYYYYKDSLKPLKKIKELSVGFPDDNYNEKELQKKTPTQLQVIADYLEKLDNLRRHGKFNPNTKFNIEDLGSPGQRGPALIQNYRRPPPIKNMTEEEFVASRMPPPPIVEPPQMTPRQPETQAPPDVPIQVPQAKPQAPLPASASAPDVPIQVDPAVARAQATTFTERASQEDEDQKEPPPEKVVPDTWDGEGNGKKSNEKFGIDNHSIDEFLSKYGNEYLGCIAHDEIPSKIYPLIRPRSRGFFVINTDPSNKPGMHWQCVFFDARPTGSGSIEFYDSFADPIDSKMQADIKGIAERLDAKTYLKLKENRVKQQNDDSDNCGYFCMNFITSRMRGKGFPEASGFDESVKGEADIHRFKKQNGFGFLPSFGQIASTIARPFTRAVGNTVERVKNVGQTIGNVAQNIKERIFFPEKKLPSSIQPLFEKYKNSKILSARIRREPILAFVDKFINLISFGKYDQAKKDLGYDKMFHLSLILQLEPQSGAVGNGPNLLIEKNERINMTTTFKDGAQVQYSPTQGVLTIPGNPTLGEFYEKTLQAVGDHQFFTYNAFQQNCQAFIADLLRSNGALSPEAQTFVMQDAKTVAKQLPFFVSKVAQFATDTAGRVRQFFGFGSLGSKRVTRRKKFEEFMNKIKKSTV